MIKHEKGVMSNKRDIFYYSAQLDSWSRILLRGGVKQGYLKEIAISLTPTGGFKKQGSAFFIRNEYIRIYNFPMRHEDDIYTHVLPKEVFDYIVEHIGIKSTVNIIDYDYLPELNLKKLLGANRPLTFADLKSNKPFKGRLRTYLEMYPSIYINPRG